MIMSGDKKNDLNINSSIIIWSVDYITLLGIGNDNKLNFEKHLSIIIPFYIFLSRQYSLLYLYLCIVNVFKYLTLSVNKKSYSHYYYIKDVRFSLDPLPHSSSLLLTYILLQNNCINNGVTNGLKFKKKKNFSEFLIFFNLRNMRNEENICHYR